MKSGNGPVETVKIVGDAISVGTIGATLIGWLPNVAAGLAIIWTAIRIYETRTIQTFIKRWRE